MAANEGGSKLNAADLSINSGTDRNEHHYKIVFL